MYGYAIAASMCLYTYIAIDLSIYLSYLSLYSCTPIYPYMYT